MKISINAKDKKELLEQIAFVLRFNNYQKKFFVGLILKYWQQGYFTSSIKMLANNEWSCHSSNVSTYMKLFEKFGLITRYDKTSYYNITYHINPELLINSLALEFKISIGETKKIVKSVPYNFVTKDNFELTTEMITGKIKASEKKKKPKRGKRIIDQVTMQTQIETASAPEANEYVNPRYANLV
jgi:hypothetical protein